MNKEGTVIAWLGHSCFAVEKDGYRIILDPYADNSVTGYGPLRIDADEVLCSHDHADHSAVQCVSIRKNGLQSPFHVITLDSWHDDRHGAKRGPNKITIIEDGAYRIAHLGDIGCMPDADQTEKLRGLDVCLVPVGGFFTMHPAKVHELMLDIDPTVVIPMHYRFRQGSCTYGYRLIAPLSHYTKYCSDEAVLPRNYLSLPEDLKKQTAILTYRDGSQRSR